MLVVGVVATFGAVFAAVAALLWPKDGKHKAPTAYDVAVSESSGHPIDEFGAEVRKTVTELRSV